MLTAAESSSMVKHLTSMAARANSTGTVPEKPTPSTGKPLGKESRFQVTPTLPQISVGGRSSQNQKLLKSSMNPLDAMGGSHTKLGS